MLRLFSDVVQSAAVEETRTSIFYINEKKKQSEEMAKVQEVQHNIKGRLTEVWSAGQATRRWIKDGELYLKRKTQTGENVDESGCS